ncbi:MAG TPA: hypothetical protein VFZ66_29670 [Herpetosiphonaceae bacterium]
MILVRQNGPFELEATPDAAPQPRPLDLSLVGQPVRFSSLAAPSLARQNGTISAVLARLTTGEHLVTIKFHPPIKHGGMERRYLDSPTDDLVFLGQAREQAA